MNPANLLRMKSDWEKFTRNHPKFPMFLGAIKGSDIGVGSVVEITITTADGKNMCTNVKLQESDMDMIEDIKAMAQR